MAKSMLLLSLVYDLCKKLPKEETYNLISQMKREALSISNNLAEGAARKSKIEKSRFFEVARSSVLSFVTEQELSEVNAVLFEVFRLISGLIGSNHHLEG